MNVCLNENTICGAGSMHVGSRKTPKTYIYCLNTVLSSRTEASLLLEVRKTGGNRRAGALWRKN